MSLADDRREEQQERWPGSAGARRRRRRCRCRRSWRRPAAPPQHPHADVGEDGDDPDHGDGEGRDEDVVVLDVATARGRARPSSSTRFIFSSSPVVTATAACCGLRPVAKAFGAGSSTMYSRGFGSPLAMQRPSTRLCSRAYCVGVGGTGPAHREGDGVGLPVRQRRRRWRRWGRRWRGRRSRRRRGRGRRRRRRGRRRRRSRRRAATERRLFWATWSYKGGRGTGRGGSELDLDRAAGLVVGLEVLALDEAEPLGDHDRGERLDLGVVLVDGVVVELPGVGDAPLGAGQLLLQLAGSSGSP